MALRIEEGEFHLAFQLLRQVIVDNETRRWVLPGIQRALHRYVSRALLAARNNRRIVYKAIKVPGKRCARVAVVDHKTNSGTRLEQVERQLLYLLAGPL